MGFLDGLLGGKRKLKEAAPTDRLFAMTTAQVELEAGLGIKHEGVAGMVFQQVGTADFKQIITETEELLRGAAADSGTTIESQEDQFGYRWVVLRDPDFEDLVVALNLLSGELMAHGYGDRLLACVFPFSEDGQRLYFIYNFKRALYYPFAPVPGRENARDNERELRVQAQLKNDLPFEPELTRWFPLWDIPL